MGPEDVHQTEQAQNSKGFRVVLCLCPPERTEMRTAETRASIRVIGMNRVTVDTGRGHRPHVLDFDAVWSEGASPKDIYDSTTKSLVEYVMKGYNGCVILYGQSTSGETHPVQACTARHRGIISRTAEDIFNCIQSSAPNLNNDILDLTQSAPEASHCRVRVSCYHISNEKIYDLLEPQVSEVCRIHDTEEVVLLEGLRALEVGSTQELMDMYHSGITHRNTGVSKGDFASKSHMVFNIMVIKTRGKSDKEGVLIASKLTLVELASSGKSAYNSSSVLDMRRSFHVAQENHQEAKIIKRSLTIFRNVIYSLSNTGIQHIPYRESKLTRVLRDCLGGNCRTCLMVTVPTQSSSVTETMSCLQFAAQALNVPSRPIHSSQIRYTPAQVPNMWATEKNSHLLNRTQILPPVSADRRSQASLPSIVTSPGPLTQLKPKRSLEVSENRSFLPHLEKHRPPEPSGYHSGGSRNTEEKCGAAGVCVMKSAIPLSRCLSGSVFAEPLHCHSAEKPLSSLSSSSIPSFLSECPNCKQERKIREEYDKFIIQVKRDRDSLSQRVTELEKELKIITGEQREHERAKKDERRAERDFGRQETATISNETENVKETEDEMRPISKQGDEREVGKDKIEKAVIDKIEHSETEQKFGEREEERQRREEREGVKENDLTRKESLSTSHGVTKVPKNAEEKLLSELHSFKKEYEGLRKSAALSITQLQKEKAELVSHTDDAKSCYERVCLENAELKAKLEALLKDANSRPSSGCNGDTDTRSSSAHTSVHNSHTDTRSSHTHTVTTNTEMLVVSQSVCQQCTSDLPQDKGNKCRSTSCSGFQESFEPPEPTSHTCRCESALHKPNRYKQLRREHSLLLDVMLVLYRREWFLQDAMPYVRRTLKKCGLSLDDSD